MPDLCAKCGERPRRAKHAWCKECFAAYQKGRRAGVKKPVFVARPAREKRPDAGMVIQVPPARVEPPCERPCLKLYRHVHTWVGARA